MHMDGRDVPIAHPDGATMVELPYGRGAFGMVAVMPAQGTTVRDFVSDLTEESWDAWTRELAPGRAYVRLPRFELEWGSRLNEPLIRLGMSDAFGAADFSRLTPGGGLWLDVVKQKAFVRVDEEGTEAAAVSGGVVVTSAPPEIRFDRPFLVVIRERLSGDHHLHGRDSRPHRLSSGSPGPGRGGSPIPGGRARLRRGRSGPGS